MANDNLGIIMSKFVEMIGNSGALWKFWARLRRLDFQFPFALSQLLKSKIFITLVPLSIAVISVVLLAFGQFGADDNKQTSAKQFAERVNDTKLNMVRLVEEKKSGKTQKTQAQKAAEQNPSGVKKILDQNEVKKPEPPVKTTSEKQERKADKQAAKTAEIIKDVSSSPKEANERGSKQDKPKDRELTVAALPSHTSPEEHRSSSKPEMRTGSFTPELGSALKKLISYSLSDGEKKRLKKAVSFVDKDQTLSAKIAANQLSDKHAAKLIHWYRLAKDGLNIKPTTLEEFRIAHPDWPRQHNLRRWAEQGLLMDRASADEVKAFFKKEGPKTGFGKAALAAALLSSGDKKQAEQLARDAWRHHNLTKSAEAIILKNIGSLLTEADHHFRAHRFLYKSKRKIIAPALRAAKHLSGEEKRKVDARIAVIQRSRKAVKLLTSLSKKARATPEILFSRVQWLRRKKKYKVAGELSILAPNDPEKLISPDAWWKERRLLVRWAINNGHTKLAYQIAKNHGSPTVNHFNEAEFIAGWLALRFLKKPKIAEKHFIALSKSADGPRSRSRSHYWLGRTAKALKKKADAKTHYRNGAKYFNTFYGQLAGQSLNPKKTILKISPPPQPTQEDVARFTKRDSVHALVVAHKAGLRKLAVTFITHLRRHLRKPGELVLLAELTKRLGMTQHSLRVGKTGMFRGYDFTHYAYPIDAFPKFKKLRKLPEKPFYFAITRQESEFNPLIVSHAGARGIMQVMPITAKHVARQHKIKYQLKRLLSDPSYNAMVATAYIADRMDEFRGSYVKSIAGFNAGPGRVRQWIRKFGDPSNPRVDPIDWIERIPFTETRHYVKKVLANLQVYRARLGKPQTALLIRKDLYRGRWGASSTITAGN